MAQQLLKRSSILRLPPDLKGCIYPMVSFANIVRSILIQPSAYDASFCRILKFSVKHSLLQRVDHRWMVEAQQPFGRTYRRVDFARKPSQILNPSLTAAQFQSTYKNSFAFKSTWQKSTSGVADGVAVLTASLMFERAM
jgi:hypothetical protein